MLPEPNPSSSPCICGSMYAAKNAMAIASRYSRSRRMDSGRFARICSSVYRLPDFSHAANHIIRPRASRPTTPPRIALRLPSRSRPGTDGSVTSSSRLNMNRGSMPWVSILGSSPTNTRPCASASAIWQNRSRPTNTPSENDLDPLPGSCAQPRRSFSGTPSKPSNSRRLTSGVSVIACRFNSPSMSSGERTVEGVALRRTMRAVPRYGAGQGTEHLKDRAHAMTRPRKAMRSGVE